MQGFSRTGIGDFLGRAWDQPPLNGCYGGRLPARYFIVSTRHVLIVDTSTPIIVLFHFGTSVSLLDHDAHAISDAISTTYAAHDLPPARSPWFCTGAEKA